MIGSYGSSKSYHVAMKIALKCWHETRKVLVVREVYDTMRESCFDLLCEVLESMDLLETNPSAKKSRKAIAQTSPMQIKFPNGSRIIFKGLDKPSKLKSINGISIVWLEEATEIKYAGYKEILGRLRHPDLSLHLFLSCNAVDMNNWVYHHFFEKVNDEGDYEVTLDHNLMYEKKTLIHNGVYIHHSTAEDNLFLPDSYIEELKSIKEYDPDLYRVAYEGKFGINGKRVFPQFQKAEKAAVQAALFSIPEKFRFCGMDFGFEESYNAVIKCAVDSNNQILYIYDEYYKNHKTDDITARELEAEGWKKYFIIADCEDPKAIKYYQQQGFRMKGCHKFPGSRLSNTRKMKRFKKIICADNCKNTIRELETLSYKQDRDGNYVYDEFNIDAHTLNKCHATSIRRV